MSLLNTVQDKISPLIQEQFPDVYKEDGNLMTLFVKAYYEFLEQSDKPLGQSRDLASRLMPQGKHLWQLKNQDGVAEASLIAYWGLRKSIERCRDV